MATVDNPITGATTSAVGVAVAPAELQVTCSARVLHTIAVAAGVVIANTYYNQPLLAAMAREFHVLAGQIGWVPSLTQIGFAAGMLFVSPFGDATERRRMVTTLCIIAAGALVGMAVAPTMGVVALASFAIGLTSIVPPLLMAFAAHLARPGEQGRAIGNVMTGLLIGILVARMFSGWVGQQLSWRAVYWIASIFMLVLAVVLRFSLPRVQAHEPLRYAHLMASLRHLMATQPVLRDSAFTGAMLFGSFNAFWTTLAFRLESPPYHYGSRVAGMFGLVGVVSAATAALAGRWGDRHDPRNLLRIFIGTCLVAFLVFWVFGHHLWGLVLGIILLDAGVQGGATCNHTRVFRLLPRAQNRCGTINITSFFLGGALGTALAAQAWQRFGYAGVCATGIVFMALAGVKTLLPLSKPSDR